MKKIFSLLLSLFFILGYSFGQNKLSPALAQATRTAKPNEQLSVIITMADQYDGAGLESRTAFMNRKQRTRFVAEELKQFSQASQAELLGLLQEAGDQVSDIQSFWISNDISCKATPEIIRVIAQRPDVRIVDADAAMPTEGVTFTETEPDRAFIQWNLTQIQAPEVWAYNGETGYTGNGVVVAVLDSGVNFNHNDLKNSMWDGGSEYPYHGYNYIENNKNPRETASNGTGVGTMVAGIIAGQGTSIQTGVAPGAKIMALRTANKNGTVTQTSLNNGMQFAIDHGADIIVVSTCQRNTTTNATYRDKMVNMLNLGIVAFTAAGDRGTIEAAPNSINQPSNCPSPWHNPDELLDQGRSANICVGATKQNGYKADFSSVGPVTWSGVSGYDDYPYTPGSTTAVGHIRPDIMAPGVNITSASHEANDAYNSGQGTALSAAHAAGVAALLLEANPNLTPANIDRILETSAIKCEGLVQKNNYYGAGRINAYDAMTALLSSLSAPANVTATANANNITLQWTAANGATSYNIYCNEECIATAVTGTSYTDVTDFSGAHIYYLRSCNVQGTLSPKSNYAYVFVDPAGPVVTNLSASANDAQQKVTLTWEQPLQDEFLRYGAAETPSNEYSGQNGKPLYWAQRFPSTELVSHAGSSISSVSIYFTKYKNTTYSLTLKNGNANGPDQTLATTTFTVASNEIDGWKEVTLSSPVAIDHTKDLWIIVNDPTANPTGSAPCTANATYCIIDNDPTGFSALYSTDGVDWSPRNNKYAWMIKANLTTGSYTYNIQRNGTTIASNKTALSYTDANVPSGVHYYTVTTNYNNGQSESFPCEPVRVIMNAHFTVTFNAGGGNCPVSSLTQGADGTITLPEASPATDCQSEGYTFAGWCTEIVEGTYTQPQLLQAGDIFVPENDMTLYAVYQNSQSESGWSQARSIQAGDRVCLVSQDYAVEFDDSSEDDVSASTVSYDDEVQGQHPFTAQKQNGGYTLKDDEGRYLYNAGGFLNLSTILLNGCVWSAEFINDNLYLRNENYQLVTESIEGDIVMKLEEYLNGFDSSVMPVQLYRFKASDGVYYTFNPDCGDVVKAPQFSPKADGIYLETLPVTLSCDTPDATIRYTTNNSEPTASSTSYSGPINLNTTTTVKAKAFKDGFQPSPVATQTYQFPTDYTSIAAFKNAENPDEIARVTSSMKVTFFQDRTLYVSDGTGGLLVYDDYGVVTSVFNRGDQIDQLQGRYRVIDGQPMLIPLADITPSGSGPSVQPVTTNVNTILSSYNPVDARLVEIKDITFTRSFDSSEDLDTISFVQNGQVMMLCNRFQNLSNNIDENIHYDITGLLGIQGSTPMIYPRDDEDIRTYHTITCAPTEHGTLTADMEQASAQSQVGVTTTPDTNYHLEQLYYYTTNPDEGIDINPDDPYFLMPDADVTIVAVFAEDVKYTVTFNPGNGNCTVTSLTETVWNGGITLPDATPSTACASQGYTFIGWTESYVNETTTQPVCFEAGATYHPTDNLTLYAVYSLESGGTWLEITNAQDIIEGQYIVAAFSPETNRYYYLRRQGTVTMNPLARKITRNIAPPQDTEAPDHLWDITKISDTEYSISYTENGVTYYMETFNGSAQSIRVTTTEPARGWKFTNHSEHGLLIQFPFITSQRYMDLKENGLASHWYSHTIQNLEGSNRLFLAPNNVYATDPECQMMVAAPEFVNVPDGLILDNNFMVEITCATPGATIYYTTDGSTPDNTSTVYDGPFAINNDCTINAIAYDSEGEHSEVVSHTFTFPVRFDNIAAFKDAYQEVTGVSDIISKINGDVQFVFRHGNYLYFRDETAALMVRDDNGVITNTYNNGDVIQGGLVGTYRKSSQQPMMIPTANPATGVSGTPVEPIETTIGDIRTFYDTYDAQLVTVIDAEFTSGYDFSVNDNFPASQNQSAINVNNYFGTMTSSGSTGEHDDITGFVGKYNTSFRLCPRDDNDLVRYYGITCAAMDHGKLYTTPDHARAGDEVTLNADSLDMGYEVSEWIVTGPDGTLTVTDNSFVMPAGDVTVDATIAQTEYTIIITALPAGSGIVTEGGTFHYGDVIELTATPNPGYRFSYWQIKNGKYIDNPHSYTVTGNDDIIGEFQATTTEYTIEVIANGNGTATGGGSYLSGTQVTVTATPDPGHQFLNWTENDEVVSTEATYTFVATGDRTLYANFDEGSAETEQTTEFAAGWNWYSSYLEYGATALTDLESAIAGQTDAATIKSQADFLSYESGIWNGNIDFTNESMYMININEPISFTLNGEVADPAAHPIALAPNGYSWISFLSPVVMNLGEALTNLTPTEGDVIKSQAGFSSYTETEGWSGSVTQLVPGLGYMYFNNSSAVNTLVYPTGAKGVALIEPEVRYWTNDVHRFATNLSMMVTLDESQFSLREGNYEIGAFVGDECRGSARVQRVGDHYVAFLSVSGEDGETVSFRLYDVYRNEEFASAAEEQITYVANAIIGSVKAPATLHFRSTSVNEENSLISVYPNPVKQGQEIHLTLPETMDETIVEVIDMTGRTIVTQRGNSHDASMTSLPTNSMAPGIYTIRVISGDNMKTAKIVVR